jgi:hypothetical protein
MADCIDDVGDFGIRQGCSSGIGQHRHDDRPDIAIAASGRQAWVLTRCRAEGRGWRLARGKSVSGAVGALDEFVHDDFPLNDAARRRGWI